MQNTFDYLHSRSLGLSHKKNVNGPLLFNTISDGNHLIANRLESAKDLYTSDIKGHFSCVNALEFSNHNGDLLASGGDDHRVLLWNTENALFSNEKTKPCEMRESHESNIFTLAFTMDDKFIYSGGNDSLVLKHDMETLSLVDTHNLNHPVLCVSAHPETPSLVLVSTDSHQVSLYDTRAAQGLVREFGVIPGPAWYRPARPQVQCVAYNPADPRLIATAHMRGGVSLWDARNTETPLRCLAKGCSAVWCSWNSSGNRLAILRRRKPVVLFRLDDQHEWSSEVALDHPTYFNECTMKSCCWAGPDERYLVTGSDDFSVYWWRVDDKRIEHERRAFNSDDPSQLIRINRADLDLVGHRSVVNQVRYNNSRHVLISSGVEKIIKVWSPFNLNGSTGSLDGSETKTARTLDRGNNLRSPPSDLSLRTTEEDQGMLSFFDALLTRKHSNRRYSPYEERDLRPDTTAKSAVIRSKRRRLTHRRRRRNLLKRSDLPRSLFTNEDELLDTTDSESSYWEYTTRAGSSPATISSNSASEPESHDESNDEPPRKELRLDNPVEFDYSSIFLVSPGGSFDNDSNSSRSTLSSSNSTSSDQSNVEEERGPPVPTNGRPSFVDGDLEDDETSRESGLDDKRKL